MKDANLGNTNNLHKTPQNKLENDKYFISNLGTTMKLTEFNSKKTTVAQKALKEHFNTTFNVEKLGLYETRKMLTKVKGLMSEAKGRSMSGEQNPAYLKLVFMEQALTHHYGDLRTQPMYNTRIVVENEEVEKSQVVLAAQEMVDTMQKMVEQVSDMLVKELPAVVDGVNSEFGTSEGEQFSSQVSEALTSLQAAIAQSKTGLLGALGVITGQGGGGFGGDMGAMGGDMGADMGMGGDEMGADMGDEMDGADMGSEMGAEEMPAEEPEEPMPSVGRARR